MIYARLSLLSWLQFFIWGAWLITLGNYFTGTKGWSFSDFGLTFSTVGIAALFMPTLIGNIADRWVDARKIHGLLLIVYAGLFFYLPEVANPELFFWLMFAAMCCYMPSLVLSYSISYAILEARHLNVVAVYPKIRIWGVTGFVMAMWIVNLTGNKASAFMFYLSASAALILGFYSLTLTACPPKNKTHHWRLQELLGLDAFSLFKNHSLAVFLIFSALIAVAVNLSNMYSDTYLTAFQGNALYQDDWAVKYSTILVSLSQVAEALIILAIPWAFRHFNIKEIIVISLVAWILRFSLFAWGNPGGRVWMFLLASIVYGVAADFFMVSSSLYINELSGEKKKNAAQGLLFMMTGGVGAILAGVVSGGMIQRFFVGEAGAIEWFSVWMMFALYILLILAAFLYFFRVDSRLSEGNLTDKKERNKSD